MYTMCGAISPANMHLIRFVTSNKPPRKEVKTIEAEHNNHLKVCPVTTHNVCFFVFFPRGVKGVDVFVSFL